MKGFVFTEFTSLVEEKFGLEVLDQIIEEANLSTQGVYTAVGSYDHRELIVMVELLSKMKNIPVPELLKIYGEHLFGVFVRKYSNLILGMTDMLDFLSNIDNHIHVEVAKLYPDAELPKFSFTRINKNRLELIYKSKRGLGDFAEGLIFGCAKHFEKIITLQKRATNSPDEIQFIIDVT